MRYPGRNGVERDGKDRTRRAEVARCVHARHGNVQRAVRLRWQRQAPFSVHHHDTAQFDAVVVDDHRLTVNPGSAHCRRGIRDVASVRFTAHGADRWRSRCHGIHGDRDRRGSVRDVARFIGGGGGIDVAALRNITVRAPAPVAVAVYRDGTNDSWRAAVNRVSDVDYVVWRTGAAQHRARIVGGAAIGDGTGDLGDAVSNDRCCRRSRRLGINGDGDRLRRGAFVARAVHVGDGQGDVIGAASQGGWRRPCPVAGIVHDSVADFDAAVVDRHGITRIAGTAQGRRGVAGGFARIQRRLRCAAVRIDGNGRDIRRGRRNGIHRQFKWR